MTDQRGLGMTFDSAADLYQQARPDYPEQLFEAMIAAARLVRGDRLLEIGCASGKATLPLARRGVRITCVEPGPALTTAARRNLASFPDVRVVQSTFEDIDPSAHEPFDLVFAATAWHWLDPAVRYRRTWELLRPGGHLAFWAATHVFPEGGDRFFADLQEIYDEIGEGLPEGATYPRPGELPDQREDIEASGLFEPVSVRHFDWEVTYDADGYIGLLDTFSGHIAMEPWQRRRLYSEIRRRLGERADGLLRRGWGAVLHVAQRRDLPAARQQDSKAVTGDRRRPVSQGAERGSACGTTERLTPSFGVILKCVEIRAADLEDERRLAAIDRMTWSPSVAPVPLWGEEVNFFAKDAPQDVLVAVDGGDAVGYVKLRRPTALLSNSHVLQIGGLAVDPAHQGRGVGRHLVLAATQEARRRGAARLTLHVLGTNATARRLYASCGFKVEGVRNGEYELEGRRVDDVLMAMSLGTNARND